jgi:hypothetical protein
MAKIPMHKIIAAEVVPWDGGEWGVRFVYDDGKEERCYSGSRQTADRDTQYRVGTELPVGVSPYWRGDQPSNSQA